MFVACVLLAVIACRDPHDFEPGDPTKPDPPAPPQLVSPANGWASESFSYPQDVSFGWQQLSGAFYQIEVYRDSLLRSQYLVYAADRVTQPGITGRLSSYGTYFWRVRAANRNWNDYTHWSDPFRFSLPNPAK
jgi:hypothetical protein